MKTAQFIGGPRDGEKIAVRFDKWGRPEQYITVFEMEEEEHRHFSSYEEMTTYVPRRTVREYMLAEMDDGQLFYLLLK